MFNWFGENEHRTFNYRPRYYDAAEDARKKKFAKVDGTLQKQKEDGTYVPGSYIKGSMRDGNYSKTRSHANKAQNIIGIIGLILVLIVLFYIAKFYTLL